MCKLNISVKNDYVCLNVKNKTVKSYVPHVLERYTEIKKFDRENGVLTLMAKMNLLNGISSIEEDWIDLNADLGFAFKNPNKIINEIDKIELS